MTDITEDRLLATLGIKTCDEGKAICKDKIEMFQERIVYLELEKKKYTKIIYPNC